jgi:hypothetical protein
LRTSCTRDWTRLIELRGLLTIGLSSAAGRLTGQGVFDHGNDDGANEDAELPDRGCSAGDPCSSSRRAPPSSTEEIGG